MEMQHFIHECPLTLTPSDKYYSDDDYRCELCRGRIFEASVYVCFKCDIVLHKSCAELPREINHLFHPQHPLTLIARQPGKHFKCDVCGCPFWNAKYHCSQCDFELDPACASLMPIANHDDNNSHTSPHVHPHPFIPCLAEKKFAYCSGCSKFIEDTIYVCLQCKFMLHEACTKFPYKIRHIFHPQHPLVLTKAGTAYEIGSLELCTACRADFNGFTYHCAACKFSLDMNCVLLRPIVKFKLHQHPLAFFKDNEKGNKFGCVCCGCNKCNQFFRCVECDFNFHLHCVPTLPLTRKHQCHRHSLTLTKSPIKDSPEEDENSEFYCDVCEKPRYLPNPTYYCAECHFVAHVSCMIYEDDLPALGEEPCLVVELEREIEIEDGEESDREDSTLAKLNKEIEAITAKLEILKQERARHISSQAQLRSARLRLLHRSTV